MHFGFALEFARYRFVKYRLVRYTFRFFIPDKYTDISSKYSRHVFKTCLQDMSSRRLQDVFSVIISPLPRRLEELLRKIVMLKT